MRKSINVGILFAISTLLLTSCNLPLREAFQLQTPTLTANNDIILSTPTPPPDYCENVYQPSTDGDSWIYAGNNTSTGNYTRKNTISRSHETSFTIKSDVEGIISTYDYSCTDSGLVAVNPIQQYLGTLLAIPGNQVEVKLNSASGITLPMAINPGDSWRQEAVWEATAQDISTSGRSVLDYTAIGYEKISVPFGTFDALRVNATISLEVSPLRISAGSYTTTSWLVPGIGLVKSEGTSHIRGVSFSDHTELTGFTPAE